MSRIEDRQLLALQDHGYTERGLDVDFRSVNKGVRLIRRQVAAEQLGHYEIDPITPGDILGWLHWPTADELSRGTGMWAQIYGSTVRGLQVDAISALPIFQDDYLADGRMELQAIKKHPDWPQMPIGMVGAVVAGTREDEQHGLWLHGDPRLICVNFDGNPDASSIVCDLNSFDEIDANRCAPLHTAWRVVRPRPPGRVTWDTEANALSWQLGRSGRDSIEGMGLCYDVDGGGPLEPLEETPSSGESVITEPGGSQISVVEFPPDPPPEQVSQPTLAQVLGIIGAAGVRAGGPLDVGGIQDDHRIGTTADGEPINALHLQTVALFRGTGGDGPLDFEPVVYSNPPSQPFRTQVHLTFDPEAEYDFLGEVLKGVWRWEAESAVSVPPTTPPPTRRKKKKKKKKKIKKKFFKKKVPGPPLPKKVPFFQLKPELGFHAQRLAGLNPPEGEPRLRKIPGEQGIADGDQIRGFDEGVVGGELPLGVIIDPSGDPSPQRRLGVVERLDVQRRVAPQLDYRDPNEDPLTGYRIPGSDDLLEDFENELELPLGVTLDPSGFPTTISFRQRDVADGHEPYTMTTLPNAAHALLFRPQFGTVTDVDTRKLIQPDPDDVLDIVDQAPMVARLEAFGARTETIPLYTEEPSRGRWRGGSGTGGFAIGPPETDMADWSESDYTAPSTASTTTWLLTDRVVLGFGRPDVATGLTAGGWTMSMTATSGNGGDLTLAPTSDNTASSLILDHGSGNRAQFGVFGHDGRIQSADGIATIPAPNPDGQDMIVSAGDGAGAGVGGDVRLEPGAGGDVQFGTLSALGGETVTGFIAIKDASGATRHLAVVS